MNKKEEKLVNALGRMTSLETGTDWFNLTIRVNGMDKTYYSESLVDFLTRHIRPMKLITGTLIMDTIEDNQITDFAEYILETLTLDALKEFYA